MVSSTEWGEREGESVKEEEGGEENKSTASFTLLHQRCPVEAAGSDYDWVGWRLWEGGQEKGCISLSLTQYFLHSFSTGFLLNTCSSHKDLKSRVYYDKNWNYWFLYHKGRSKSCKTKRKNNDSYITHVYNISSSSVDRDVMIKVVKAIKVSWELKSVFFFNQTPLNDNISLRTFCCFSFSTSLIPLMTKEQLSSASGSITDKRQ